MEINEEIFIRTNCGNIFKTNKEKIFVSNDLKTLYIQLNGINNHARYDVTKHSKDIIDLIEKKDVVLVDNIKYTVITFLKNGNDDIVLKGICKDGIYLTLGEVKIQSILTHEQFEANAYKIEKEV